MVYGRVKKSLAASEAIYQINSQMKTIGEWPLEYPLKTKNKTKINKQTKQNNENSKAIVSL